MRGAAFVIYGPETLAGACHAAMRLFAFLPFVHLAASPTRGWLPSGRSVNLLRLRQCKLAATAKNRVFLPGIRMSADHLTFRSISVVPAYFRFLTLSCWVKAANFLRDWVLFASTVYLSSALKNDPEVVKLEVQVGCWLSGSIRRISSAKDMPLAGTFAGDGRPKIETNRR